MLIKFSRLLYYKQNVFCNLIGKRIPRRNFCKTPLPVATEKKNLDYLLILDFEATCTRGVKIVQEIIEFPCLKINVHTMEEEARFHHYVRPILNPTLTDFCIQLTGIIQDMVDDAPTFTEVYRLFSEWREKEGLTDDNSLYITSGDWDLGAMMPRQCALSGLELPRHMTIWAEIKKLNAQRTGAYCDSLLQLIKYYNLEFEGRQHSGIVDCLNIYNVVKKMAECGVKFQPTCQYMGKDSKPKVQVLNSSL